MLPLLRDSRSQPSGGNCSALGTKHISVINAQVDEPSPHSITFYPREGGEGGGNSKLVGIVQLVPVPPVSLGKKPFVVEML